MERFDIKYLKNEYGLSCVENYILYLLAKKNGEWPVIFEDSFQRFNEIIKFIMNGERYSTYSGVPRLQNTAERMRILKKYTYEGTLSSFTFYENKFYLMKVTREFVENQFKRIYWRDDHYILVQYLGEGEFEFLNDNPPVIGILRKMEVEEIYANKIISIDINAEGSWINKDNLIKFVKMISDEIVKEKHLYNNLSLLQLRDAVGIAKVLTKRMQEFFSFWGVTYNGDYYSFLSDYYIQIEYSRIRKDQRLDLQSVICAICDREKEYYECYLDKLTELLKC